MYSTIKTLYCNAAHMHTKALQFSQQRNPKGYGTAALLTHLQYLYAL